MGVTQPLDLVELLAEHPAVYDVYVAGRIDGRTEGLLDGYAQGWAAANEEIARLQRAAAHVVHRHAALDAHQVRELKVKVRTLEAALRGHGHRPGVAA